MLTTANHRQPRPTTATDYDQHLKARRPTHTSRHQLNHRCASQPTPPKPKPNPNPTHTPPHTPPSYHDPDTDFHRSFPITGLPLWQAEAIVTYPGWYELELATANMLASACAMGRLATCLANGGEFRGRRILREETIKIALGDPQPKMMKGIGEIPVCFTRGGFNRQETEGGYVSEAMKGTNYRVEEGALDAFYGWAGWGGLSFSFNPARRMGSSFCSNAMTWDMFIASTLTEEYLKTCGRLVGSNTKPSPPQPVGAGLVGASDIGGGTVEAEQEAKVSSPPASPTKKSQVAPDLDGGS